MRRTPIQVKRARLSSGAAKTLGVMVEAQEELDRAQGQAVRMEWLRLKFLGVTDAWSEDHIRYAVRGYLLYILGCTLFADKTCTWVPIYFIVLPHNLDKIHT